MKNLFYVQSGISVALALKVIDQLSLKKDDCIFLLGRKISMPEGYHTLDTSLWTFKTSIFFPAGWIKAIKSKRKVKQFLTQNNITSFDFYTTSFSTWFAQILMRDGRRKKLIAIEEGRASFYTETEFLDYINIFYSKNKQYRIFQLKTALNYFFTFYPNPKKTIDQLKSCDFALVTSEESYSYLNNLKVINDPFFDDKINYEEVECLMAFSYPVEDKLISIENYVKVLEETFDVMLQKGISKIHYKFHPQQLSVGKYLERYKEVLQQYAAKIEFIEMPKETILEVVVANSSAIVLSDYSSLMIYSSTFGNQIYSNFSLLEKYEPMISKSLSILPQILLDLMNKNKLD